MKLLALASCLLPFILLATFAGCDAQPTASNTTLRPARPRIIEKLAEQDNLLMFVDGLMTYPEFEQYYKPRNATVTVFAPTNKAIRALFKVFHITNWPALTEPRAGLFRTVLRNHIVPGQVLFAKDIANNATVTTMLNNTLNPLRLDKRAVSNGIVVRARNSDALVLTPDTPAARSVIHVVDDLLLPVDPPLTPQVFNTVAKAVNGSGLTTLAAALTRAGLAAAVANGSLVATVYAPTNAAFAEYFKAKRIANLTAVPPATLRDLLLYHITPEYRTTGGMQADQRVATLLPRRNLRFTYKAQKGVQTGVIVKGDRSEAAIARANVFAGRSVVHVIGKVLEPKR